MATWIRSYKHWNLLLSTCIGCSNQNCGLGTLGKKSSSWLTKAALLSWLTLAISLRITAELLFSEFRLKQAAILLIAGLEPVSNDDQLLPISVDWKSRGGLLGCFCFLCCCAGYHSRCLWEGVAISCQLSFFWNYCGRVGFGRDRIDDRGQWRRAWSSTFLTHRDEFGVLRRRAWSSTFPMHRKGFGVLWTINRTEWW